MTAGTFTRTEIESQPEVWQKTLEQLAAQQHEYLGQLTPLATRPFVVTGCGSTYYLSHATASVLRSVGVNAWALPASELALLPQGQLPADFVLLAISRSGTTTETLWATERYRAEHPDGQVVVITCVPDTPLVALADVTLIAPDAQEQSVAQTRSFSTMTLLGQALAGFLAGDAGRLGRLGRLPQALDELTARTTEQFGALGDDAGIERLFFLGMGPLYGIACEAMLKTKEMSCAWAEAYHTLEFRHGPMAVITNQSLVVGLIGESTANEELAVLRQMKGLGARTVALVEQAGAFDYSGVDLVVELRSGLDEWERPPLYLPPLQRLALHRAISRGLDPDRPVNLTAVITL